MPQAPITQVIVHIALVVRDDDEAIDFHVNKLGFDRAAVHSAARSWLM